MKELGYGKGYKYPHSFKGAVIDEECIPDKLKDRSYYKPSDRGYEKEVALRMDKVRNAKKKAEEGQG